MDQSSLARAVGREKGGCETKVGRLMRETRKLTSQPSQTVAEALAEASHLAELVLAFRHGNWNEENSVSV